MDRYLRDRIIKTIIYEHEKDMTDAASILKVERKKKVLMKYSLFSDAGSDLQFPFN